MTPSIKPGMRVLDLFSAAAGGWSLGLHRAGFQTVAACEAVDWRRTLYAENNPGVLIYDDVRTLTGERLFADLGTLPDIVVGSPPCQDISSANTKGKGVDGERSGLFFEAVRIIGEVRPRWFALENSANLRTRGADRVLGELEDRGYACWAHVVGGDDIGANHERKRSWIIGCDPEQLADADGLGRDEGRGRRGSGFDLSFPEDTSHAAKDRCGQGVPGRRAGATDEPEQPPRRYAAHAHGHGEHAPPVDAEMEELRGLGGHCCRQDAGNAADADQAGQADGSLVTGLRQAEIANDGCGSGRGADGQGDGQVGLRPADRLAALQHRADWSLDDLAGHIRLDDGLPAWLAGQRVAVGGPRGTSAASLVVEAFGDAVLPQIPEAIGRAILRTEAALLAVSTPQQRAA